MYTLAAYVLVSIYSAGRMCKGDPRRACLCHLASDRAGLPHVYSLLEFSLYGHAKNRGPRIQEMGLALFPIFILASIAIKKQCSI